MWFKKFTEQQQQDYQQQVIWQHPERPVLKSWAMEARDCNIFVMTCFEITTSIFFLGVATLLYKGFGQPGTRLVAIVCILILSIMFFWLITSLTRQKKLFVYRLTEKGFEVAGWRRAADNIKKIYFGTMIVCGVILLGIVIVVPQAIFMLFIGPAGMALSYVAIGNNKKMWEQERDYSQKSFDWDELEKIVLFRKRCIISFEYDTEKRKAKNIKAYGLGIFHIFCPKMRYEEMITFVKTRTLNTPCVDGKLEITAFGCA